MKLKAKTKKQLARQVGSVARQSRLQRKLTQEDVAEQVGVVTEVYGRLERGNMLPKVATLRKLCVVLDLDANEVLGLGQHAPRTKVPSPASDGAKSPSLRRILRLATALNSKNRDILGNVALHMGHTQRVRKSRRMAQKMNPSEVA